MAGETNRLIAIDLDEASLGAASADADHERRIAIFDLLESNVFEVEGEDAGPYALKLLVIDQRLIFEVSGKDGGAPKSVVLSLTPFRRVIKDYFLVCNSYYDAIRNATPTQIEAIDMGRRSLHNEGSRLLEERLAGRLKMDFDTARRLFTLICALHVRG
ncbi:MAG TPA: UPF0262 family protein [Caulobacterales bacterium]|nr:UPF0262 family protein [Caulobacterales bacterium]